jgi:multiple sugar transport system permease protein/fructooligosaccharide transport system permease protein
MRSTIRLRRWLTAAGMLAVGAVFLAPVLWMAAASLKPEERIHADIHSVRSFWPAPATLENYRIVDQRTAWLSALVNTAIVVALVAIGGVLVNSPAAYAFARLEFPGRDLLFFLVVAGIILPLEAIVIPLFMTVRSFGGLIDVMGERPWTLAALSVPFMVKAFNVFLFRQHFLSFPRALEEAAMLDGAGWGTVFWRIALPNARPVIITAVLLDVVVHWNDFLWPLVVCGAEQTRTVQLGLGNFFTQPPIAWGAILAYAVVATLPVMAVFVAGQRFLVRAMVTAGVRG